MRGHLALRQEGWPPSCTTCFSVMTGKPKSPGLLLFVATSTISFREQVKRYHVKSMTLLLPVALARQRSRFGKEGIIRANGSRTGMVWTQAVLNYGQTPIPMGDRVRCGVRQPDAGTFCQVLWVAYRV